MMGQVARKPGLEFIKNDYSLKLKTKRIDWLLADTCPQAASHCALFWELKFYNLEASIRGFRLSEFQTSLHSYRN